MPTFAVVRRRAQEVLQVLADDGVERGVLRVTGSIRWLDKKTTPGSLHCRRLAA